MKSLVESGLCKESFLKYVFRLYFRVRLTQIQVKDNQEDLTRLANRLQHVLVSLEESRSKNLVLAAEYEDAMSTLSRYGAYTMSLLIDHVHI